MKIGILGCGNLGQTLGGLWSQAGHQVMFASGQPSKAEGLARQHGGDSGWGSYAQVIAECPTLLYTLRRVPPKAICAQGWSGKTVIDCNQPEIPLAFQFRPRLLSLAQELASDLPTCQVVKAFCLHPVELYHHGRETLQSWGVQTFYCGNLPEDKERVKELSVDLGLLPFDCGDLSRAHLLESQADFWRLFQIHQGQSLVSQFQLVGYPEPTDFQRRPAFDRHAAGGPTPLPTRDGAEEAPPQ